MERNCSGLVTLLVGCYHRVPCLIALYFYQVFNTSERDGIIVARHLERSPLSAYTYFS